jgi:hypothetical protein
VFSQFDFSWRDFLPDTFVVLICINSHSCVTVDFVNVINILLVETVDVLPRQTSAKEKMG